MVESQARYRCELVATEVAVVIGEKPAVLQWILRRYVQHIQPGLIYESERSACVRAIVKLPSFIDKPTLSVLAVINSLPHMVIYISNVLV